MTNPERDPAEVRCASGPTDLTDGVEIIPARDVPLGGPRAMTVRRTLPSRRRSLIGAWCFVDHYGPDAVHDRPGRPGTGGMSVAPHPHVGLQTVSWLFTGEIEHRDSAGHHAVVRPGELNLMTAGRGISHSEVSTPATDTLHGVQLWVALPDDARHGDPGFQAHVPEPVERPGLVARVFLGALLDVVSPVATATPLLGAELRLEPGARVVLDVDAGFEHGVLVDDGALTLGHADADADTEWGELAYLPPGRDRLELTAGEAGARVLLLGGPPFGESIVMWWNFVGRSHEEIVAARDAWQAQLDADGTLREGHFGVPLGDPLPPIPAPELPHVRLRERS